MNKFYLLMIILFGVKSFAIENKVGQSDLNCKTVVTKNCVVIFDYTLTDYKGNSIDTSHGSKPRVYLHGQDDLLPSIIKSLEGRRPGEKFEITLTPSEGYGEYDENLIQVVSISEFGGTKKLEKGMEFSAKNSNGSITVFTVVAIVGNQVVINGNHPLAGKTLKLSLEVISVRPRTSDEIKNGVKEN